MEMNILYTEAEKYSDEELNQIIAYASELLVKRHSAKGTYEDGFVDIMRECGLDEFSANASLQDFKDICAVYMQKTEPLYLEDIQEVLRLVLHKNEYVENPEAEHVLSEFVSHSFGNNIPSIAEAEKSIPA